MWSIIVDHIFTSSATYTLIETDFAMSMFAFIKSLV